MFQKENCATLLSGPARRVTDEELMGVAVSLAAEAFACGEIPVGAVVVRDGEVIGRGRNRNRELNDPTMHAEVIAIRDAAGFLQNERLTGCVLYVTKEPCAMCAGAIVHSRIARVVIGAEDIKYGACGTVFDVCGNIKMNHVPEISFGLMRDKSSSMLREFFQGRRPLKKN